MRLRKLLPFGFFMNTSSFFHQADPRSKVIFIIIYLSVLGSSTNALSMAILALSSIILILFSKLPLAYVWSGLKGILPFLLILFFYHLLFNHDGQILMTTAGIHIHLEGMATAVMIPCKLALIILTTTTFTVTTTPKMLTDGLETMLRPLLFVRFPVRNFVLMSTLAFRFIPLFIDEVDSMLKANKLRNARCYGSNLQSKIQSRSRLLIVVLLLVFRRADQLTLAMEARCFPGKETQISHLHFSWRDWIIIGYAIVLISVQIYIEGGEF
ncbi:energy-coupling factor transporter transmembrane component T [Paenibacillus motobuensis]|uniref:energy-coupling factor transporter transmembrane component T family protein n=1 Tax=Paenibacillus motobuensis TaxID=295324 RepID=UPI0031D0DB55